MVVRRGQKMSGLIAFIDGGSLGNPGPAGIGLVIDGAATGPIRIARWIGHQDNNVAEYVAPDGSVTVCLVIECHAPARLFRFPSSSEADDGRV